MGRGHPGQSRSLERSEISQMKKLREPTHFRLRARMFKTFHECTDPTCDCQKDEFVQKFKNKIAVELTTHEMKTGKVFGSKLVLGPFETEDEAKAAVSRVQAELQAEARRRDPRLN